jgi:hypothetical protein
MPSPWTSALYAARTARSALWMAFALSAAHASCAPAAPKTSTILPGHRATMDSLGYALVGATEHATIRRGQTRSHLARLRAGHCYRLVALGASDSVNLEAALYTPDGVRAVQSLTSGRAASVGYCAAGSGTFRFAVSARDGQGAYAYALWDRDDERSGESWTRGTCVNPLPLELGGRVTGSLVSAQDNAGASCAAGRNPDVVHVIEVEQRQRVQLVATGEGQRALYVRRSCAGGGAGANTFDGPTLECAVPRNGGPARIDTTLDPGRYYVFVEAVGDGLRGAYTLTTNEAESPEAADVCARARAIEPGVVMHGTTEGLADVLHGSCASSRFPAPDVTYALAIAEPSRVRVTVESEGRWDTGVYIRSTCADPESEVVCNDDADDRFHARVARTLAAGRYAVTVDGYSADAHGAFTLAVESAPAAGSGVGGDRCADAPHINLSQKTEGDTFAARDDISLTCGGNGPDQLFRFTLPRRALVRATLAAEGIVNSDATVGIGFVRGCAATGSAPIGEFACARGTMVDAVLPAGTHFLVVDGVTPNDFGQFAFTLEALDAEPVESACREAQPLALGVRTSGTTVGRLDRLQASCGHGARSGERVHTVNVNRRGRLVIELRGRSFDAVLSVRRACERQGTELVCALENEQDIARAQLDVEPGSYSIVVDGFDRNNTGAYDLEARLE